MLGARYGVAETLELNTRGDERTIKSALSALSRAASSKKRDFR
jgi:hypothetical protein